jgi:hypothetical protein
MKCVRSFAFILIVLIQLFFFEIEASDISSDQIKTVIINLAKNHPYTSGAALVGFWSVFNYFLVDEEDEEESIAPKSLILRVLLCGIAIDCFANGADSVPGTFYWLSKEYSERSIITFFPWLGWQGIKSLLKKLY